MSCAQLALTKGKEIHWTEYGVGGGTCQSGNCIAEVSQALCHGYLFLLAPSSQQHLRWR